MSRFVCSLTAVFFCLPVFLYGLEPLPKEAAFSIRIRVSLTFDYGFMRQEASAEYLGSSVCVSSEGYLITNVHVADPGTLVASLIGSTNVRPKNVEQALLEYRITNQDKLSFSAKFRPEIEYEFGPHDFLLRVVNHNPVSDSNNANTLHLIGRNSQDTMIIKLDSPVPLPYISLPAPSLQPPEPEKRPFPTLFALSARQNKQREVVTVTRVGQLSGQSMTIVCRTKVCPITMTTLEGDSGSIVVDGRNQPVGLLASHELPESSDLSFMIPIQDIADFYHSVRAEVAYQEKLRQTQPDAMHGHSVSITEPF